MSSESEAPPFAAQRKAATGVRPPVLPRNPATDRSDSGVLPEHWAALAGRLSPETIVRANEPLARRTTLRVGGPAELYVEPASESDLGEVVRFCAERRRPWFLLGRGSNLLIRAGGIRGVVICLSHPSFARLEVSGETIRCGAGVKLKTLAVEGRRAGLCGLEFFEGIPGSVGGALRMNAGAMGSSTFEVLEQVRCMDPTGQVVERPRRDLEVHYRGCPLFRDHLALAALFRGRPASAAAIRARMDAFSQQRWATQPSEPSAGCVFKNPPAISAGKLIEELGLKGTRVGGARVSEIHANFLVNDGDATAQDMLDLIQLIQQRVRAARGLELETEVQIVGEA